MSSIASWLWSFSSYLNSISQEDVQLPPIKGYHLHIEEKSVERIYTIISIPKHDDLVVYNIPGKGYYVAAVLEFMNYFCSDIHEHFQAMNYTLSNSLQRMVRVLDHPFRYVRMQKFAGIKQYFPSEDITFFPCDLEFDFILIDGIYNLDESINREKYYESLNRLEAWLMMRNLLPGYCCPITGN
jgi:hypothetical protein